MLHFAANAMIPAVLPYKRLHNPDQTVNFGLADTLDGESYLTAQGVRVRLNGSSEVPNAFSHMVRQALDSMPAYLLKPIVDAGYSVYLVNRIQPSELPPGVVLSDDHTEASGLLYTPDKLLIIPFSWLLLDGRMTTYAVQGLVELIDTFAHELWHADDYNHEDAIGTKWSDTHEFQQTYQQDRERYLEIPSIREAYARIGAALIGEELGLRVPESYLLLTCPNITRFMRNRLTELKQAQQCW